MNGHATSSQAQLGLFDALEHRADGICTVCGEHVDDYDRLGQARPGVLLPATGERWHLECYLILHPAHRPRHGTEEDS